MVTKIKKILVQIIFRVFYKRKVDRMLDEMMKDLRGRESQKLANFLMKGVPYGGPGNSSSEFREWWSKNASTERSLVMSYVRALRTLIRSKGWKKNTINPFADAGKSVLISGTRRQKGTRSSKGARRSSSASTNAKKGTAGTSRAT